MGDASQFVNNYQMTFIKNKFFSTKKQLRAVKARKVLLINSGTFASISRLENACYNFFSHNLKSTTSVDNILS